MAVFLRDTVAAASPQRLRYKEQIGTDGFIEWLDELVAVTGMKTPALSDTEDCVLEIARPGQEPSEPQKDASPQAHSSYEKRLESYRQHKKVYDEMHSCLRIGDGLELVYSTIFIVVANNDKEIRRHIVSAPALVSMSAKTGRLRVVLSDAPRADLACLPPPLLMHIDGSSGLKNALTDARSSAELAAAVTQLAHSLGSGTSVLTSPATAAVEAPQVGVCRALLLRRRESSALRILLDDMVEDMKQGGVVTEPFKSLLDPAYEPPPLTVRVEGSAALALDASDEQRKLVERARRERHLVIQGPPGTGKTHTIANLLSVLLAEGRRVMVTAENDRALREVQSKLPEALQPLLLPLLQESGGGSLTSSVNSILANVQSRTLSDRVTKIKRLETAQQKLESELSAARENLRSTVACEREVRSIGCATMPLLGHLIALRGVSSEVALAEKFLSDDGRLTAEAAQTILRLHKVVGPEHEFLRSRRIPESPFPADDYQSTMSRIDAALQGLTPSLLMDYVALSDIAESLISLAPRLSTLPVTKWNELSDTADTYSQAVEKVHAAADKINPAVSLHQGDLTVASEVNNALNVLRDMVELRLEIGDRTVADLVDLHHRAAKRALHGAVSDPFTGENPEKALQVYQLGIDALRKDTSGLLSKYASDMASSGSSQIEQVIAGTERLPNLTLPIGLEVQIERDAPPDHELLAQAKSLLKHLQNGGKIRGLLRTPPAVRQADALLRTVRVSGSLVDTVMETERVITVLVHRINSSMTVQWAASQKITVPSNLSLQDWVVAVRALDTHLPAVVSAIQSARRNGTTSTYAYPGQLLDAAVVSAARDLADRLEPLVSASALCDGEIRIAGEPVRGTSQAHVAYTSLEALACRLHWHSRIPREWRNRVEALDAADSDALATALALAAEAVSIPAWAWQQELSTKSIQRLVELIETDVRRNSLLIERSKVKTRVAEDLASPVGLASPATVAAREAADIEDFASYRAAIRAISEERNKVNDATLLASLLTDLKAQHPRLAKALLMADPDAESVLQRVEDLQDVRDRNAAVTAWKGELSSLEDCHQKVSHLQAQNRIVEQQLAVERCWRITSERLASDAKLRSALSALESAVKAVPKHSTAKTYASHLLAVQQSMREAAPAIPAWVLSVDRAAELLGYLQPEERFDVIIIDEASQAWFPAMFLYALANQVIVVGDDMQTSPSVKSNAYDVYSQAARTLLPGHRISNRVDDDLSLYDVATTLTMPIAMRDHFRCMPEIIDISNRLSYKPNGKTLVPARVATASSLEPVVMHSVQGVRATSNSANTVEVESLVDEVVRCHADKKLYAGKSFGVVVAGSNAEAHIRALRIMLDDKLGPEGYEQRDMQVGTASQFQGAERDVMFLSLVDVPIPGQRLTLRPHEHKGRNRRFVQQLNVAVSRARDQLHIFHSFGVGDLKSGDVRLIILQSRVQSPTSLVDELAKCQSEFEKDVVRALHQKDPHLKIRTQVPALGYSLDIVVEDVSGRRLVVECDGDRWHTSDTDVRRDLYRQRTLEGMGWRFYRFLASEWYGDPERYAQEVLKELGTQSARIQSKAGNLAPSPASPFSYSLTDRTPTINTHVSLLHIDAPDVVVSYQYDYPEVESVSTQSTLTEEADFDTFDLSPIEVKTTLSPAVVIEETVEPFAALPLLDIFPDLPPEETTLPAYSILDAKSDEPRPDVAPVRRSTAEVNRALAASLVLLDKPKHGATWDRAKALLADGLSIEDAARLA